jgi:hypothetical protein
MSLRKTFGEYLDMVKNGFKNKDKIIEAMQVSAMIKNGKIGNGLEVTNEAVAEILKRKDICAECPFNSRNTNKETYKSNLPWEHCTLCKCRIGYDDSKEYCLSCVCGAEAWNEMNPDMEPMEVKWTAFKN